MEPIKKTTSKIFLLVALFLPFSLSAQLTGIQWNGNAGDQDFNNGNNWSSGSTPSSSDSCYIDFSNAADTIKVTSDITVGAIYCYGSGYITVQGNTLKVESTSTFEYNGGTLFVLIGSSSGEWIFEGPVDLIAPTNGNDYYVWFRANEIDPGRMVFKDDLYIGPYGRTDATYEPDMHFDAPGSQTIDAQNSATHFYGEDNFYGGSNSPTITLKGDPSDGGEIGTYDGSMKLRDSTWLDAGLYDLDPFTNGGANSCSLATASTFEIRSTNDYPSGWGTYFCHTTSTTYYNGGAQDVSGDGDIGITYGNLKLGNSTTTKELNESFTTKGHFTIESGVTAAADWNEVYTIQKDFVNNGSFDSYKYIKSGKVDDWASRVIMNGSIGQEIRGSTSPTTFYDLVIKNSSSAGVTLNTAVKVDDEGSGDSTAQMRFYDGIMYSDSTNMLTLSDNADCNSGGQADSYLDGPMKKIGDDAFIFPTGDGNVWARIEIGAPANTSTEFTAHYFYQMYSDTTTDNTLDNVSNVEYWQLDRYVNNDDVLVTLYWQDSARSGISKAIDKGDLRVGRYNGTDFTSEGSQNMSTGSPGTITTGAKVTSFSPFSFSSTGAQILPVELLFFDGKKHGEDGLLEWATASEYHNDRFEVERSPDGEDYQKIGTVDAIGTSTTKEHYQLIDPDPLPGINYYRLVQVDKDGKRMEYGPVSVRFENDGEVHVHHDPSSGTVTLFNAKPEAYRNSEAVLYDARGRALSRKPISTSGERVGFKLPDLEKGIYFMRIRNEQGDLLRKKLLIGR